MDRFTVVWTDEALEELSRIWIATAERASIAEAVQRIDHVLMHRATDVGLEFYADRLLVIPPLAVVFSVSDADLLVRVSAVWGKVES